MMLNRTPSGAQKKIRQRKEEKNQFQSRMFSHSPSNITTSLASTSFSYFTPTLSNSSCNLQSDTSIGNIENSKLDKNLENGTIDSFSYCNNYNNHPNMDYRSMVDLHEYRSILPEDNCNDRKNLWKNDENSNEYERNNEISLTSLRFMEPSDIKYLCTNININSTQKSQSNLLLTSSEKPCRLPRSTESSQKSVINWNNKCHHQKSSSFSTYDSQATESNNVNTILNNSNFYNPEIHESVSNGYNFGKPTVQVYPMPVSNPNVEKIINSVSPSNSSTSLTETLKKLTPPPVPKKNRQPKFFSPTKIDSEEFKSLNQEFELPPLFWTSKSALNKINSNDLSSNYEPKSAPPLLNFNKKTATNSNINDNSKFIFSEINNYNHEKSENILNSTTTTFHTLNSCNSLNKNNSSNLKSDQLSSLKANENLLTKNKPYNLINTETHAQHQKLSELKNFNLSNDFFTVQKLHKIKSISYLPPLINLKNSLNYAFFNREEHSEEELKDLENKRLESIEILLKKTSERKTDLDMVQQDLEKIDEFRLTIFQALLARGDNSKLLTRLEIHILEGTHLAELNARIQIQLEKLNNCDKESSSYFTDEHFIENQKRRLLEQLDDIRDIQSAFNQRDNELDTEINVALDFNPVILREWRYYKSIKHKLNIERKQIEENLQTANKQLEALQKMPIFNKTKNIY